MGSENNGQVVESDEEVDFEEDSVPDEELEDMLEKGIESANPRNSENSNEIVPHTERIRHKLIDKGKNHFDVLPNGWIIVDHISGMPIYLHRPTRSVTCSRPYNLGTASARVSLSFFLFYFFFSDLFFCCC